MRSHRHWYELHLPYYVRLTYKNLERNPPIDETRHARNHDTFNRAAIAAHSSNRSSPLGPFASAGQRAVARTVRQRLSISQHLPVLLSSRSNPGHDATSGPKSRHPSVPTRLPRPSRKQKVLTLPLTEEERRALQRETIVVFVPAQSKPLVQNDGACRNRRECSVRDVFATGGVGRECAAGVGV